MRYFPSVVGESRWNPLHYPKSRIREYADQNRKNPNPAEAELEKILNEINGGVLKNRFTTQHVISGDWIVDFFVPENRLAIEVDGSIHESDNQKQRDHQKETDCSRFDITIIRITNDEIFGDRQKLIQKLRLGWKQALKRENKIVGSPPR
jgi:very-short-patch-repair endonuclease